MTKDRVRKIWISGLVVLLAGLAVGGVSLAFMLTNAGYWVAVPTTNSWNFVPRQDGYFWTTVAFTSVGFAIAGIGAITQLVAWIGAVANTSRMQDKTWFLILLIGGLIGLGFGLLGFAVMVAYLVAGPEAALIERSATPYPPYPRGTGQPPATLAPMS